MTLVEELFEMIDEADVQEESKKEDPKAKVRNKPNPVFDAKSSKVKDNKDHFPLGNANQARNALARANGYKRVPNWYKGTLKELKAAVVNAVKKEYPSIEVTKKATD